MMETVNLTISDETLRDGEQQVGVFFEDKPTIARLIAQTGVHQIAIMPAIHPTEAELVSELVTSGLRSQLIASTLMTQSAIDQAKACGVRQIILFHAVSDRLLLLRDHSTVDVVECVSRCRSLHSNDHRTIANSPSAIVIDRLRQTMLTTALHHVRYAVSQGMQVCFAAEDASRADFHFLLDCINSLAPYIDQFLLCDTVGILTPEKTAVWIQDLRDYANPVPLAVHFHNDMGLALENTIQAVRAGASGFSGTFCGIGERAGNVPLEQVLYGLRMRFGWEVAGINYDKLVAVVQYMHQRGFSPHMPYSPESQRQESGIHVHSLLRDRHSYAVFPHNQPEIWFGKYSGASNFQYLFEHHLQQPLTRSHYERLRIAIKAIALEEKRSFSVDEVLEIIREQNLLDSNN